MISRTQIKVNINGFYRSIDEDSIAVTDTNIQKTSNVYCHIILSVKMPKTI